MKAAIFDLDDTLVDSSSLRHFRDTKDWDSVRAHLTSVRAFDGAADFLRTLKAKKCKVGLVTSSPKWYAEHLVAQHAFPVDAIIAHGDYKYGKPGPEPIRKALAALGVHHNHALAIGDRCIDTASALGAEVKAVAACWSAANLRELYLSYPQYVARSIPEAQLITDAWLSSTPPKEYAWPVDFTPANVWRTNPSGDYRMHITNVLPYSHARYRHGGGWSATNTNSLIDSFKSDKSSQRYFKESAAQKFCTDLGYFLPPQAYVTFILPATKKGEQGYDDRWELLSECLNSKGFRSLWPIQIKQSTVPAHKQDTDSEDREPDHIKANLKWVCNLPEDCSTIYLIDDVITKGGHMRAYADMIKSVHPHVKVHCVAWALFTSAQWYQPAAYP